VKKVSHCRRRRRRRGGGGGGGGGGGKTRSVSHTTKILKNLDKK
jgi:hypothetical protein